MKNVIILGLLSLVSFHAKNVLADDGVYVASCMGQGFKVEAKIFDDGQTTMELKTDSFESLKVTPNNDESNGSVKNIFDLKNKVLVFMGTELPSTKFIYLYALPHTVIATSKTSYKFQGLATAAQRPFNLAPLPAACTLTYQARAY